MTVKAVAVFDFLRPEGRENGYGQRRCRNSDPFASETHTDQDQSQRAILLYLRCAMLRIFCGQPGWSLTPSFVFSMTINRLQQMIAFTASLLSTQRRLAM